MAFTEDMSPFFADFGLQAVFNGGDPVLVMLDKHDEEVLHGRAQSTLYSMTYPAAELAGLTNGAALTVDGDSYVVQGVPRLLDDGALKVATLYVP